jgi:enamine deaminase RidA (YjgF/YER057c/UK114 family)
MKRRQVASGALWEDRVGYSRAVAVGRHAWISGTVGEGETPYEQSLDSLQRCLAALRDLGFQADDVVRTRAFVVDISKWNEVGRAHAEIFGEIRPATTMVQVAALIDPKYLVEFEVEAYKVD